MKTNTFKWYNSNSVPKFAKGAQVQKAATTEDVNELSQDQSMKQLYALILSADEEIKQGQAGTSAMYLAELMQDPKAAALIDQIAASDPEVQSVLDQIDAMVGFQKRGGCAKKKRVRKAAKGCKPCKQLMKIGGKLVNVLTDCEGNIIHKHQSGGWLIPKGENGLQARQQALLNTSHNATWLGQQQGYTRTAAGPQYYKDGNNYYTRTAFQNTDGTYGWSDWSQISALPEGAATGTKDELERVNAYTDTYGVKQQYYDGTGWKNAESYFDKGSNSVKWRILGDAAHTDFGQDDAVTGANWADGTISKADATAAGIDVSKFSTGAAPSVHGVSGTEGNPLLGTVASKPTVQQYISHHGSWQNAYAAEDDILQDKKRASHELARRQRQNMRRQMRAQGSANIDLNGDNTIGEGESFTTRADARKAIRSARTSYIKDAKQIRVNNQAKILNTLVPQKTTPSSASLGVYSSTAQTTGDDPKLPANDSLRTGGRLNKYQIGGAVQKYEGGKSIHGLTFLKPNEPVILGWTNPFRTHTPGGLGWSRHGYLSSLYLDDMWGDNPSLTVKNWYPIDKKNGQNPKTHVTTTHSSSSDQTKDKPETLEGKGYRLVGPTGEVTKIEKKANPNIRAFTFYSKLGRDKVKELQTQLNKLGYDVEVNGLINDRLVNAVKAFQKNVGAEEDGMAGQTTLGKISEALNYKQPESVDLTTKVNPAWAAQSTTYKEDVIDPTKGMISDARTVDGSTEYLVGDVWVDEEDVTPDQINKYKKGLGTLGSKKEVKTEKDQGKTTVKSSSATPQQSILYIPQEYMPAWTVYNKNGGWLNKFK